MCGSTPLAQVFPSQLIKLKTKRLRVHLLPFQFCPDCIGELWNRDSIVTVLFINNQTFASYISAFAFQIPDTIRVNQKSQVVPSLFRLKTNIINGNTCASSRLRFGVTAFQYIILWPGMNALIIYYFIK